MSTNNEYEKNVYDIGIKAELQTATQRFTLTDSIGTLSPNTSLNPSVQSARVKLAPRQSTDFIVNHEVKELGQHILVCSVHYTCENERKYFRKFFKFQVMNPLGVKTKVLTQPNGAILMEVQISNTAHCTLTLDRFKFEPSELYKFTDLNSIFKSSFILNVGDTRQYLYLLEAAIYGDLIAQSTPSLGKLDIGWKTNMGQSGRLQTATLSRKVGIQDQFEIKVTKIPTRISVEEPFQIECLIYNYGDMGRVTLSGVKSKMGSVLLSGYGDKNIGNIPSANSGHVNLTFFPLYAGLHRISGLRISDAISGCVIDIDHLIDVFVYDMEHPSIA